MYTLRLHTGHDPAEAIAPIEAKLRRAFDRASVVRRERFLVTERLAREVAEGKKSTTIRVDHHALEYPATDVLPVFADRQIEVLEEPQSTVRLAPHTARCRIGR